MNEGTFEATLHATLTRALPSLAAARITHQTNLSLRLGRNVIVIQGDLKRRAKGRLDVLVSVDDTPAILLELKAPGRGVVSEDVEQARSYSRLLNPMPPLFGVSDGQATRFFRTYDGAEWQSATIAEEQLKGLLDDALTCAAADHDSAVRLLLGRRPSLWAQVLRRETEAALATAEGDIGDFSRPLAASFSIPRTAASRVQSLIEHNPLVVLTGPPLCGKTNVLAQVSRRPHPKLAPFYIDAAALNCGIWQHLGNTFSLGLLRAASAEEARQWAWAGLRELSEPLPLLVIDGWRPGETDQLRADLEEIVGRLPLGSLRIVLGLDDEDFERLTHVPGRATKTAFGRVAKEVRLGLLDDAEFDEGIRALYESHRASFYPGAHHNRELRVPRLLRLNAAKMAERPNSATGTEPAPPGRSAVTMLAPITSVDLVKSAWRRFTSGPNEELRSDLERLATAWVTVPPPHIPDDMMAFEQLGRCALPLGAIDEILGPERFRRLRQQGILRPVELPAGHFVIMRLPELLAAAGAAVVAKRLLSSPDDDAAYRLFLRETQRFPLSDVVGATVILRIAESVDLADSVIRRLLDDKPTTTDIAGGSALVLVSEGSTPLPPADDGEPLRSIGNIYPALVLSHLAAVPMAFWDQQAQAVGDQGANATIIAEVGSIPHLVRRIDTVPIGEMQPIETHRVSDEITVVCHDEGIVEPIVQAILFHVFCEPDQARELADWAVEQNRAHLVWRLRIAANLATTVTEPEIAAKAKAIDGLCLRYWRQRFNSDAH